MEENKKDVLPLEGEYSRIIYLYFLVTMNRPDDYMTIDSIQFT